MYHSSAAVQILLEILFSTQIKGPKSGGSTTIDREEGSVIALVLWYRSHGMNLLTTYVG